VGRLLSTEDGQAVIEYAVLGALISVVAVVFMTGIGIRVGQLFQSVVDAF